MRRGVFLGLFLIFGMLGWCDEDVLSLDVRWLNVDVVAIIESGRNPFRMGSSGEIGLFQISPVVLKEWNQFHPNERLSRWDLFRPAVNRKVAVWYLRERIPAMLRAYGLPCTIGYVLWAYNAGIGNVVRGRLPEVTRRYLARYVELDGLVD